MVVTHNDPDCLCLGELIYVEIIVAGDALPIFAITLLFSFQRQHSGRRSAVEMCIGTTQWFSHLSMVPVSMPLKGEILHVMKNQISSLDARPCIRFGSRNRASVEIVG